jgi:hypothetical protein
MNLTYRNCLIKKPSLKKGGFHISRIRYLPGHDSGQHNIQHSSGSQELLSSQEVTQVAGSQFIVLLLLPVPVAKATSPMLSMVPAAINMSFFI